MKVNIPSKTLDRQGISRILHIVLYGEKFADTIHGRLATTKISKRRRDIRDRRDDLSEQGDIGNEEFCRQPRTLGEDQCSAND